MQNEPAKDEVSTDDTGSMGTLAGAGDSRAAFMQASADLLLNISPPSASQPSMTAASSIGDGPVLASATPTNDALLLLAQSMMEAQAPRPQFSDFASVPVNNPFSAPPSRNGTQDS